MLESLRIEKGEIVKSRALLLQPIAPTQACQPNKRQTTGYMHRETNRDFYWFIRKTLHSCLGDFRNQMNEHSSITMTHTYGIC